MASTSSIDFAAARLSASRRNEPSRPSRSLSSSLGSKSNGQSRCFALCIGTDGPIIETPRSERRRKRRAACLVALQLSYVLDQLFRETSVGVHWFRVSGSDIALALIEESGPLEPLFERK